MNTNKHESEGKRQRAKGKNGLSPFSVSLCLCGVILLLSLTLEAQTKDFTRHVNPFIGTGGHGHTFPGATLPFGMVQLSPDTRIDNWDGSSGYHYSDDIIYGFSHTHLSGTGIPDGCDILFMPTVGEMAQLSAAEGDKSSNGYASKFSHASERAEPGYYSVRLDDDGILAEMTATRRVGFHRYTFPQNDIATLMVDLEWRDKLLGSTFRVVSSNRVEGYRRSSSWAKDQIVYFVADFSAPVLKANIFRGFGSVMGAKTVYENSKIITVEDPFGGQVDRAALQFRISGERRLSVKVGISFVSIESARKNLDAELPHWDFDKVRADAKAAWNKELSKIEVSGGTPDQTTNFYTALYHTMIHPNVFNDVDGRYKGHDGKIHQLPWSLAERRSFASPTRSTKDSGGSAAGQRQSRTSMTQRKSGAFPLGEGQSPPNHYTVFSLWDTFRATHPLYTIIDQKRTVDFINTFIRIYEQGGRLPVWELWGEETDTMIGYHAVSVIADAMAKGIKGFDYEKAYAAAKHSAELDHLGLAAYKKRGYISMEDENESVSKTLEYAYNDWCIGLMASLLALRDLDWNDAKKLERTKRYLEEAKEFYWRAGSYENLFDPSTGFMRPKKNGGFVEPFAPNEVTFGFTEGNSWQYSFFAPQDVSRLIELMGGHEKFAAKLDELFTTDQKLAGREQADLTGLIGQYAHGNEPSHHIAYLYNEANQPWKTQFYVRKIMDEFYKPTPDGLIGNEDCGQMSAWYVLSASGFYPVNPVSLEYSFGTPLFEQIKYRLENGRTFTIRAPNVSDKNIYIRSATLNGKNVERALVTHKTIMKGGTLNFMMSDMPVKNAFKPAFFFTSTKTYPMFTAVPSIVGGAKVFTGHTTISISTITPNAKIYFTTDGSEPSDRSTEYVGALRIDRSTQIRAIAVNSRGLLSKTVDAQFLKKPNDWTVKVLSGYSTLYTGGGDNAIIDGIRGTTNFASGEWQGIQGKPYETIVDLKRETDIRELGASFLQVAGPWIWMPDRIEFEVSTDGINFTRVAEIKPGFPQKDMNPAMKEFRQSISPRKARHVRIRAFNFGKIPSWHPGAGGDPWIFVDEVLIN